MNLNFRRNRMLNIFLVIGLILLLRVGQDTLFLAKIDAFNRGNLYYSMGINFIEAIYGITVIKIILDLMDLSPFYVIAFGGGSLLGGLVIGSIKRKLDRKLMGQRRYFSRISLENDVDRYRFKK
jgi:hypothetical protein